MANIQALVDSGATNNSITPAFAKRMGLGPIPLDRPQKIWNIDNTENKAGSITHFTDLDVQTKGIHRPLRFLVTDIGNENIVLGYPWLATYEPTLNWRHATIDDKMMPVVIRSINPKLQRSRPEYTAALTAETCHTIVAELEEDCGLRNASTELAIAAEPSKETVVLPAEYREFARLFDEEASHHFPPK